MKPPGPFYEAAGGPLKQRPPCGKTAAKRFYEAAGARLLSRRGPFIKLPGPAARGLKSDPKPQPALPSGGGWVGGGREGDQQLLRHGFAPPAHGKKNVQQRPAPLREYSRDVCCRRLWRW